MEIDASSDLLETAVGVKGFFKCALFVVTPLHKAALFGHLNNCWSERMPEFPQLVLLRHEVNHLEMDVSRDLLDTAVGVNGFFG